MFYVKAVFHKDNEEVIVGPYPNIKKQNLAVEMLEDAGTHGHLFDIGCVTIESYFSKDYLKPMDEGRFLDIAAKRAPYYK